MLNRPLAERRRHRRLYARVPMSVEITSPEDGTRKSKTVMLGNISESALYFESDELLPIKAEIKVAFKSPKSEKIIRATASVVRIETSPDEKIFGIGATFIEITDEDKKELGAFIEQLDLEKLLKLTIEKGASDLHLIANSPPVLRIQGELQDLDMPKLSNEDIQRLVFSVLPKKQIRKFEQNKELDFGLQYDVENRFRINLHFQRGYLEAAFRLIVSRSFSFKELHIPDVVKDLARLKEGLVLVAGPTGSGKSTTIAAMVDLINQERRVIVITLERPIEYVHKNIKSFVKQREIGVDTNSFSTALQSSLRQDPNVIVVGELDDIETVKTAFIAAEAGYLVIASFHAPNTLQGIDRLAGMFPPESHTHVLTQLANCLKGMITQLLIPTIDKKSRVLAVEVVIGTDAMKRIIRAGEFHQIPTIIQTGKQYKMQSMYESIKKYVDEDIISEETAQFYSQEFGVYAGH